MNNKHRNMTMKKTALTAFVAAILLTCVAAPLAAQTKIGWTDGTHSRSKGVRVGTSTTQGIAIRLPEEKAVVLKGESIATVYAAFCSSRFTDMTLFITDELGGDYLYSQEISSTSSSWTEYALDTPYEITGKEIYVGFIGTISASYSPLSFDYTDGYPSTSYVYSDGAWVDYYDEGCGSANIQLILSADKSFTDASLRFFSFDGFLKAGDTLDVDCGSLFNFGSQTITSIDVTYKTGDSEAQTLTLDGLSIESGALYDMVLPGIIFDESGTYDFEVEISSVNGADYDDAPTDNSGSATLNIYPQDLTRNFLVENFTTQQCSNCPAGHKTLESAVGDRDDVCVVAHHSAYGTDAFTMTEDVALLVFNYTSAGGTFAPAFMTNRYRIDSQSSSYANPAFYTSDATDITDRLDLLAEMQPYVAVDINSSYDETTRELSGEVTVAAYATPPDGEVWLNLYIIQDSIVASQTSGGDSYTHRHVFRGTIDTGNFGTEISISAGETYTHSFSYTVPESITSTYTSSYTETFDVVLEQMSLVAFASAYNASDATDCIVYNAAEVPFLGENSTTGITTISTGSATTGTAHRIIYDTTGKVVRSGIDVDTSGLTNGVYIVRSKDGTTRKLVVE